MLKSVAQFVNDYVDKLAVGQCFQARDVADAYHGYCKQESGEWRLPYSDTIQRTLRTRRAQRNDVNYYDYGKSIWWKNDHVATAEERDAYRRRKTRVS